MANIINNENVGGMSLGRYILRTVLAVDFLFFGLSFVPWFQGTEDRPGAFDHVLGAIRILGFRIDFAFVLCSTFFIGIACMVILFSKGPRKDRADGFICMAWLVAFVIYIVNALKAGVLDFG